MSLVEANRIERVVILTRTFVVAGVVHTAEAAEEIGVSRRTIQRDLAEMSRVLAIQPDYHGRWIYLAHVAEEQLTPPGISPY